MNQLAAIQPRRRLIDSTLVVEKAGWKKLQKLGNGRDGVTVLLCNNVRTENRCNDKEDRRAAIKVVPTQNLDIVACKRLQDEINTLAYLAGGICENQNQTHPRILRLIWHQRFAGYELIACLPLTGGPLHRIQRAAAGGKFERSVALYYAAEVAAAVEHLHQHGIMHRDIKASNIVLDANGHATLIDFGFAKRGLERAENKGIGTLQRTHSFCGTLHAMAPELISREGHGLEVDWWALGILLWELLAGAPPFGYGENGADAIATQIKSGIVVAEYTVPPISTDKGGSDGSSDRDINTRELILKLLVLDPEKRLGCRKNEIFDDPAWKELMAESAEGGSCEDANLRFLGCIGKPPEFLAI